MKKELIIASIITVVLIMAVLFTNKPASTGSANTVATPTTTTVQTTAGITASDVAKHNSASDCWIIINQKAYNVTTYLNDHPGGSEEVIKTCGTDATTAYDAIKGGRGHSMTAEQILPSLLVGAVQ